MMLRLTLVTTLIALFGLSFSTIVHVTPRSFAGVAAPAYAEGCWNKGAVCATSRAGAGG